MTLKSEFNQERVTFVQRVMQSIEGMLDSAFEVLSDIEYDNHRRKLIAEHVRLSGDDDYDALNRADDFIHDHQDFLKSIGYLRSNQQSLDDAIFKICPQPPATRAANSKPPKFMVA